MDDLDHDELLLLYMMLFSVSLLKPPLDFPLQDSTPVF